MIPFGTTHSTVFLNLLAIGIRRTLVIKLIEIYPNYRLQMEPIKNSVENIGVKETLDLLCGQKHQITERFYRLYIPKIGFYHYLFPTITIIKNLIKQFDI
jgi:hypothetical protein